MTEDRPVHPSKALLPIEMTELGIVMEVRPVQRMKAASLIKVTELGMVTVFNFVCIYAIKLGIDFTSLPITRLVSGQSLNHLSLSLLGELQFAALKVTEVRPVQPENALLPIEVMDWGIEIEVRFV